MSNYCEVHETRYPSKYDRCPLCEAEDQVRAEKEHLDTRDRRDEPW